MKTVFRMGELFSGPGGIAYGAHKAKSSDGNFSITHAWASEFGEENYLSDIIYERCLK